MISLTYNIIDLTTILAFQFVSIFLNHKNPINSSILATFPIYEHAIYYGTFLKGLA